MKRSKTDQAGKGAHICILGKQVVNYVQYQLLWHTWRIEGLSQVRSLSLRMKHHLLRQNFLQEIGLPYLNFAGHNFRIGAATAATKVGLEDSTIHKLGWWSSAAFMTYIRLLKII